jgi:hypothetical protein
MSQIYNIKEAYASCPDPSKIPDALIFKPEEFLNATIHLDLSQFFEEPEALIVPSIRTVQPLNPGNVRGVLI